MIQILRAKVNIFPCNYSDDWMASMSVWRLKINNQPYVNENIQKQSFFIAYFHCKYNVAVNEINNYR